jgi:SAM-dependent methyltransferase
LFVGAMTLQASQMTQNHWQTYHQAWSQLTPPLRPHRSVVTAVKEQIRGRLGRTIVLGVTPELADVTSDLVAVDRNLAMVVNIWPGNSTVRHAIVGDWRTLSFSSNTFSLCVGDGSLNNLDHFTDLAKLLLELKRIMIPRGRLVCRLYLAPTPPETPSALKDAAMSGTIGNFHALKIRLGMALAAHEALPQIGVANILDTFNTLFPDRDGLARASGWSRDQIDTIDFYRGSATSYILPTEDQILGVVSEAFSDLRLVSSGTYEMAEHCPLLVADLP